MMDGLGGKSLSWKDEVSPGRSGNDRKGITAGGGGQSLRAAVAYSVPSSSGLPQPYS